MPRTLGSGKKQMKHKKADFRERKCGEPSVICNEPVGVWYHRELVTSRMRRDILAPREKQKSSDGSDISLVS